MFNIKFKKSESSHCLHLLEPNMFGIKHIPFNCENNAVESIKSYLNELYLDMKYDVVLLGTPSDKDRIILYNDRNLKPFYVKVDDVGRSDELHFIFCEIKYGKLKCVSSTPVKSTKLHFGDITPELGFKTLSNRVHTNVNVVSFSRDKNDNWLVKDNEVIYLFEKDVKSDKLVGKEVEIIGRISTSKYECTVQVLKIV